MRVALLCLLAGCHGAAPRSHAVATCADPAADAHRRSPQAEPHDTLDPDGDGAPDPVFADCDMDLECDFLIYACGVYLGTLRGAEYAGPRCVEAGTADVPCKLSVSLQMIHGETQEYFYEYVDGAYAQTGAGELSPADPY